MILAGIIYLVAFAAFLEAVYRAPLANAPEPLDEFFARMRHMGIGR